MYLLTFKFSKAVNLFESSTFLASWHEIFLSLSQVVFSSTYSQPLISDKSHS